MSETSQYALKAQLHNSNVKREKIEEITLICKMASDTVQMISFVADEMKGK